MENFDDLIRRQSQYKESRDQKYKQDSLDRLSKILKKKIETTMIGALSSIENHFSFLWDNSDGINSEEKEMMFELFQKVRSEILDKGNAQARNVDSELSQYEVKWLRYRYVLPVKFQEGKRENKDGRE
jgi:hypothetical protein